MEAAMSAASIAAVIPPLDGVPRLCRPPLQSHSVAVGSRSSLFLSGSQLQSHLISQHSIPRAHLQPTHLNLPPRLALSARRFFPARAAAAPTPVVAAASAAPRGGRDGEYDNSDEWDDSRASTRRPADNGDDYSEDFFGDADVALPPGARFGQRDQPDESWMTDSDWSRGSAGPRRGGQGAGRGRMRGSAGGGDGWGELEEAEGAAERRRVLEEQGIARQRRGLGFKGGRGEDGGRMGRSQGGEGREIPGLGREETRRVEGLGFTREREGIAEGRREGRSSLGVRRDAREERWAAGGERGFDRDGRGVGRTGESRGAGRGEEDGWEGSSRSRGGSSGERSISRRQWEEYEEEGRDQRRTSGSGAAAAAAATAAAATAAAGATLLPLASAAPSSPAIPSAPSPPPSPFPSPSPTSPAPSPSPARAPKLKLSRPRGVPSPGKPGEGVRPGVPVCYGCGAELQTRVEDAPGYIPPDRYEMKRRHKQLRSLACTRCQQLSHGRMVAAVTGHGGYRVTGPADMFVTAEALRQQLTYVRGEKALVVKLVDLVDFSGSFLSRIRDIVGPNPIVLVITKVDLVPEGTHMEPLADWVLSAVAKKKLNVLAVHFVSSKARTGLSSVAATIQRERQGRDVYVLGAANVGKSAFICALLDEMASRDIMAAAARRRRPVASAMPGTTLGPICIKAFTGGGDLYDTPGVHLHHRMAAMMHPWDLHHLGPKRRLRPFVVTGPLEAAGKSREEGAEKEEKGEQTEEGGMAGGEGGAEKRDGVQEGLQGTSLFWGGLVRIDVVKAPPGTALTFFGPVAIRVSSVPTTHAHAFYEAEVGRLLVPPSQPLEEPAWEGLPSQRSFSFQLPAKRLSPVADIAISGLGWVSLSGVKPRQRTNPDADVSSIDATNSSHTGTRDDACAALTDHVTSFEDSSSDTAGFARSGPFEKQANDVELLVHVPKGIEVFVRAPMPVGWFADDWYQYEELSEKEEMARPRVFVDDS
ncbi:hypothetical protein CLOP_g12516 [Closterium sp. NIES-67]|nr:hypothetical protein CLOP_g12516 [Closterium sp. NIES-67]